MKITSFFKPKKSNGNNEDETKKRQRDGEEETEDTSATSISSTSVDDSQNNNKKKPRSSTSSFGCPEVDELWNLLSTTKKENDDDEDTAAESQQQQQPSSSWQTELEHHFRSTKFQSLAKFVASERKNHTVYPPLSQTFAALQHCPLDQVKVVIVGQDPYHGPNQAHGLCFSVLPGERPPPSLKNIYKELHNDKDVNFTMPSSNRNLLHGHLIQWANQGVLMLNSVLTVQRGKPNSHSKRGWETVTDEILKCVVKNNRGVVFLLWGKPATAKAQEILKSSGSSRHNKNHTIICTSHPSPLGATKTKSPFLGSKCFSRCNTALQKMGHEPIDWNIFS